MQPRTGAAGAYVSVQGRLSEDDVRALRELVAAATAADGVPPLGEHTLLHVRHGGGPHAVHIVARAGEEMLGYAHLDVAERSRGGTAEIVVHPRHRRHGIGAALVRSLLARSGPEPLRLWAHGNHVGAERLAHALGFDRVRDLWQMRMDLALLPPDTAGSGPALPGGVTVRTFVPGTDDDAWVALNARAFAEHPEQGRLGLPELHTRMQEPWFDPAGFFVAERDGRLVGFHWTKVHGGAGRHGHDTIGEVYVLGVDPAAQGGGLGRALTLVGLRHLRSRGLDEAMLYVDADNTAAIRTYLRLGFRHESTDAMYERAGDGTSAQGRPCHH
jgi:mycothiol synthase